MFRVAFLGVENSHTDTFLKYILVDKIYTDIEVVGVYTDDESANQRMSEKFGVYIAKSYDEFVGKVDGVVITARHGKNHLKYARPYLESGVPMFIDKPITASEEDAVELVRLAKKYGVKLTGGSSCIHIAKLVELKAIAEKTEQGKLFGGFLRAPVQMVNNYGNFWFYSQHLVQMMQEIFGYYPKSVHAHTAGLATGVVVKYEGFDVYLSFVDQDYSYYLSVSAAGGVSGSVVEVKSDVFETEFRLFYDLLCGAEQPQSMRDFISPVFVISAIERSLASGKEEAVNSVPIEEELNG